MIELEDRPEDNTPGKFASTALDKLLLVWHTEVTGAPVGVLARSVVAQAVDSARVQGISLTDLLSHLREVIVEVDAVRGAGITEEKIEEFLGAIPMTEEVEYNG